MVDLDFEKIECVIEECLGFLQNSINKFLGNCKDPSYRNIVQKMLDSMKKL